MLLRESKFGIHELKIRNGRYVADTDARSIFTDTRVEVLVYCCLHNLDRGFIIFMWNLLNFN
jgi:hypothetical protein